MDIVEVKKYLRVDFEDDDSIINLLIEVAKDYITNGFSKYDESNPSHKLLLLKAVASLYENREKTTDKVALSIRLQQSVKGFDDI